MRIILLCLLLLVSSVCSLITGPLAWAALDHHLLGLRAIRLGAGIVAGSSLAVAGVMMQGLFRNPLASPSVSGVSAGSSLAVQAAMMASLWLPGLGSMVPAELLRPLAGFLGALVALGCLLMLIRRRSDLSSVLLLGMVLSLLFSAMAAYLLAIASDRWELGRALVAFSLGGIDSASGRTVALTAPLVVFAIAAAWWWGRTLDVSLTGEREAQSLGVDTAQLMRWVLVWTALLAACAVTIGGGVGFVGLVVPNVLRAWLGPSHRTLVIASAIGGAAFLTAADVCARACHPGPGEIPLGAITSLVGAPFFLWFFQRERRRGRI